MSIIQNYTTDTKMVSNLEQLGMAYALNVKALYEIAQSVADDDTDGLKVQEDMLMRKQELILEEACQCSIRNANETKDVLEFWYQVYMAERSDESLCASDQLILMLYKMKFVYC